MKKISEKDLSLDKQIVSNLTSVSDTKDKTDNELICGSKVCTDSHYEICCVVSVEDTCPEKCPMVETVDICPVTNDSLCDACSDADTCTCPITETQHCPVTETQLCPVTETQQC